MSATRGWFAVGAALIPVCGFMLAATIADRTVEYKSVEVGGLAAALPYYLSFVALPSFFPLIVARHVVTRLVVLTVLTGTAAIAGVLVVTTDDAQAGLALLWVPAIAVPLGVVIWLGQAMFPSRKRLADRRVSAPGTARLSDRLGALVIDSVIVGTVLVVPLTRMSHDKHEIEAAVVGIVAGTVYLGVFVAVRRQTIGHSLMRLSIVDSGTLTRVGLMRACLRGLIVVLEVLATATIVLAPIAVAELLSVGGTGRSLTDRLLRTTVLGVPRPVTASDDPR